MIFERLYWKIHDRTEERHFKKLCAAVGPGIYYDRRYRKYFSPSVIGETGPADYVASELVRTGLIFHYVLHGSLNHTHSIKGVLLAAYNQAAGFAIPDEFKDEYSQQEFQLIEALRQRGIADRTSE